MKSDEPLLGRSVDGYEEKYMSADGGVLYRDKMVGKWPWHAALLSPVLISGLIGVIQGAPLVGLLAAAAAAGVMVPIWLLFSVLRVTVTTREVHVQFGLWGPKIPIAAILSCKAVDYNWKQYGGFGIRYRAGTWVYNMVGDQGKAVQVQWMDGDNKKTTIISSKDNATLAAAINHARALADAGGAADAGQHRGRTAADPRVRVSGEEPDEREEDAVEEGAEQPASKGAVRTRD